MTDWRHVRTERLWLDLPTEADVDDLHAIHADPDTWRHFPSGRHTTREKSEAMVGQSAHQFDEDGLGYWSARDVDGGPVVGRGGCAHPDGLPWWNLYYRFATSVQGRGYAVEMSRVALAAASDQAPERAVLAYLLEHNLASRRVAERLGMRLIWTGPDAGNPDPDAVRLVFCDREPDAETLVTLEARFRG